MLNLRSFAIMLAYRVMYWEWVSADETVIWAMRRRLTAPSDVSVFKRRSTQQRLIPSHCPTRRYGGLTDDTGQTPGGHEDRRVA